MERETYEQEVYLKAMMNLSVVAGDYQTNFPEVAVAAGYSQTDFPEAAAAAVAGYSQTILPLVDFVAVDSWYSQIILHLAGAAVVDL